ncbi:MAG: DUF3467 domain-containing protein [Candidatus Nanohaloarchaeota archaeon QJJ-7]|nr:DUF3467 domain-containing protein [Candidatus Nanohaloarchaeota archaeon QJJ-7]
MPHDKQFKAEHGKSFTADSITIMHGKGKIILDFKRTAPRFDQTEGDSRHTVITEHEPVVMNPKTAKMLKNLLEDNLENYEEKFGEIELPERGESEDEEVETHGYIG